MLDRNHPLPLYYQLAQALRDRVVRGEFRPGDAFPSERELCLTYGLSRMTVRQAVSELAQEGLVRRDRGRGTYVSRAKFVKRLSRLLGFTEEMRARGKSVSSRLLRLEAVPARSQVADMLQIAAGETVILVERLRLADNETVSVERSHLHFDGCNALLNRDLNGSLYKLLIEEFGRVPTRASEELEPGICDANEASILKIREGEPVMLVRRRTLDQSGNPFEYVESVCRGDSYVFAVDLVAEDSPLERQERERSEGNGTHGN